MAMATNAPNLGQVTEMIHAHMDDGGNVGLNEEDLANEDLEWIDIYAMLRNCTAINIMAGQDPTYLIRGNAGGIEVEARLFLGTEDGKVHYLEILKAWKNNRGW